VTAGDFKTVVVVSPGGAGDERKDQDRAAWYPQRHLGVVCDGTTTSLHARTAAEQTVRFAPGFFGGDVRERVGLWAEYLLACRADACRQPPRISASLPAGVQDLLRDVARGLAARSFQTTCVAARFQFEPSGVDVEVLQVGDSPFLVFSPHGMPLWPAPVHAASPEDPPTLEARRSVAMTVQPGDDVLIRLVAPATRCPDQNLAAAVPPVSRSRWLIGEFVTAWPRLRHERPRTGNAIRIVPGNLLMVPAYLIGTAGEPELRLWNRFPFSPRVHVALPAPRATAGDPFSGGGAVTAVLPDDAYTCRWLHYRARFPHGSVFILASDGLTRGFADAAALWEWLAAHQTSLIDPAAQTAALDELHERLRARQGDDDIAFVLVRPESAPSTGAAGHSETGDHQRE
jgi:serine/threonine protein phosphatase PrpC